MNPITTAPPGEDTLTRRRRVAAQSKAAPFRVLLVDDDPAIVRLVRKLLESDGMDVIACETAGNALEALDRDEWELCLLDRWLPDFDGIEICRYVKAQPRYDTRQVIVISGFSDVDAKIEAFAAGADDYIAKPFQPVELLARVKAARRVVEMQKQLVEMARQLEELSVRDSLTGLFNRRHFSATLDAAFDHSQRYARPLSLALIDVDSFKSINDTLGHQAGDAVLKELAQRLTKSVRSSDFVARYGGEEFAVLLPETRLEDALSFGEKLRATIAAQPVSIAGVDVPVTVSVGAASVPHTTLPSPDALVGAADQALYRAKRNGRNRVEAERRKSMRAA